MAHYTKFSEEISKRLGGLLASGVPLKEACTDVEIDPRTFYRWRSQGRALLEAQIADDTLVLSEEEKQLVSFCHTVTRADAQSQITAIAAIRSALVIRKEETVTTKTIRRTKIATRRKVYWQTLESGEKVQVIETDETPYVDEQTTEITSTRDVLPDAHLALEFLSRKNPDAWARRMRLEIEWRDRAIRQIQSGELTWEILTEMFDDEYAQEMFFDAGVEPPNTLHTQPHAPPLQMVSGTATASKRSSKGSQNGGGR